MMGPQHALSGAAAWLTGSWVAAEYFNYPQSATTIAIGTAVCAGGALLPDMDMSGKVTHYQGGSTVARSFGVFSLFIAEVVEKLSLGVYKLTSLKHDPERHWGHRTLTHTLPFAVLMGWLATWLCDHFGKWAVMGILFVMIGFALRGLFHTWADKAGWIIVTLVSAGAAYFAYLSLPEHRGFPLIGFAVGAGCIVHLLGDIITREGVPILWPIPTGRRLWRMVGLPNKVAIAAGSKAETVVLRVIFATVAVIAGAALLIPAVLRRFGVEV